MGGESGWTSQVDAALACLGQPITSYISTSTATSSAAVSVKQVLDSSRSYVAQLHEVAQKLGAERPVFTCASMGTTHFVTLSYRGSSWSDSTGAPSIKKGREGVSLQALQNILGSNAS